MNQFFHRETANGHPTIAARDDDRNGTNGHHVQALSVVVPTRNEAGNIVRLLDELEAVLPGIPEIIFVDDSTDETPKVIEAERARRRWLRIVLIHRSEGERADGLAGAVVRGIERAAAPWVCVMDADLQHPPERVPDLLARAEVGDVDIVVASRYCGAGSVDFGRGRSLVSRGSTRAAQLLFPRSLRAVTDPMSGFFLVRRAAVAVERLRPDGFKILLEILVRSPGMRVAEVPFHFGIRHAGESKASLREGARYLRQLVRLRLAGDLVRFVTVGATGLAVNSAAFVLFTTLNMHYLLAAVVSTQLSTAWNFALIERWVFVRRGRRGRHWTTRFTTFLALNNLTLVLRGPALVVLVSLLGLNAAVANLLTLVALFALRFVVADTLIWARHGAGMSQRLHWYRIHDAVTVESPVKLHELERFRCDEPVGRPTIRVRIGRLNRRQSTLVGGLTAPGSHMRYDEGLGRFGFAVDIAWGNHPEIAASSLTASAGVVPASHAEIVASSLLRLSPHVLYTNVVEPTLRWCLVERGYALAHAACISHGGSATLITARTDTGKTTTILKTLDRYPATFLSDDLTLIRADGRVLAYPKPLTISRHTVAAVAAPLLSFRERLALIVQSRVHSRSGRQFGQLLTRLGLPTATINAVVQLLVPPPKFHVERLVPSVDVAGEATVGRFVVIDRGDDREAELAHNEAVDLLLANTEDAYGFPPYPSLAGFLSSPNGRDLRDVERQILERALTDVPAVLLGSRSMNWSPRVAALAGLGAPTPSPALPPASVLDAPVPVPAD